MAGERDREGQRLDRERGGDSRRRQRVADRAAYAEVTEGRAGRWVGDADAFVGLPAGLYLCCQGFQLPSVARGTAPTSTHAITIPGRGFKFAGGPVHRRQTVVAFSTLKHQTPAAM